MRKLMGGLNVLRFVFGFTTARAILFLAPLMLANLLPIDRYGQFELAQSYASIGALLLGLGLSGTVPLIRMREEVVARWDTLLILIALIACTCMTFSLFAAFVQGVIYSVPVLAPLFVATLMMQGLWATSLKSDGRSTTAVFVEASFWVVAVLAASTMTVEIGYFSENVIVIGIFLYAISLMAVTLFNFSYYRQEAITFADLRNNITLGLPLMLTGLLTVIVSSSGRLVLGQTVGTEEVGLYAVLYRAATLPLIGHQILVIGFFRQLFIWSDQQLRARIPVIVLGVSAMVVAFWFLEPYLGWLLGRRFAESFSEYRPVGLVLLVQTILWSAIALGDLVNTRLQITGRVTKLTAPYLGIGLGSLTMWTLYRAQYLGSNEILLEFVIGHFALVVGFYLVQCVAAWRLGYRFYRLWSIVLISTAGVGFLIHLGEQFR